MKLIRVLKTIFGLIFLRRPKGIVLHDSETFEIEEEITEKITFDQIFFLYNLYQWKVVRPQESVIKLKFNSVIAINYNLLREKYEFLDGPFGNFKNKNGIPINPYVENMYKVKEKEGLISESALEYFLTEKGKRVVEIVKRGNHYDHKIFHESIKHFNQDMIEEIDENIEKIKQLSDINLISTSLSHI